MRVTTIQSLVHSALIAVALIAVIWLGFAIQEWKKPKIKVLPTFPTRDADMTEFYENPLAPVPHH